MAELSKYDFMEQLAAKDAELAAEKEYNERLRQDLVKIADKALRELAAKDADLAAVRGELDDLKERNKLIDHLQREHDDLVERADRAEARVKELECGDTTRKEP